MVCLSVVSLISILLGKYTKSTIESTIERKIKGWIEDIKTRANEEVESRIKNDIPRLVRDVGVSLMEKESPRYRRQIKENVDFEIRNFKKEIDTLAGDFIGKLKKEYGEKAMSSIINRLAQEENVEKSLRKAVFQQLGKFEDFLKLESDLKRRINSQQNEII